MALQVFVLAARDAVVPRIAGPDAGADDEPIEPRATDEPAVPPATCVDKLLRRAL